MRAALAVGLCALLLAQAAAAVEITNVYHTPAVIDPGSGESVHVHFELSGPARVTLRVFDGRDLEVRAIESEGLMPAGAHTLSWDGRTGGGSPVPREAYHFTLAARTPDGQRTRWDVTDATRGDSVDVRNLGWDADAGVLRYALPHPARIRLRAGLRDGALLATPLNWVARPAGTHADPWGGMDASGEIDLTRHPALVLHGEAFQLGQNAILVGPPGPEVQLLDALPEDARRRPSQSGRRRRMFDFSAIPIESRGDFPLELSIAPPVDHTPDEVPIIRSKTPIQLDVSEPARQLLLDRRFEATFYVDGSFAFEAEVGFLPMTWQWDPEGLAPGEHYLTANLRGYQGQFGIATLKVKVE